jgi:uncharacterized peroxidase-related enzyme
MGHIASPPLPGIIGLLAFRPESAKPLMALTEQLLRGPSPLTSTERELIAAAVSAENACRFCYGSHAGAADALAGVDDYVKNALAAPASLSAKMQALISIARAVAKSGTAVSDALVKDARDAGATDIELHDAVLVAAAFCMFNRYVDGLGAITPDDPMAYKMMGKQLADDGYLTAIG